MSFAYIPAAISVGIEKGLTTAEMIVLVMTAEAANPEGITWVGADHAFTCGTREGGDCTCRCLATTTRLSERQVRRALRSLAAEPEPVIERYRRGRGYETQLLFSPIVTGAQPDTVSAQTTPDTMPDRTPCPPEPDRTPVPPEPPDRTPCPSWPDTVSDEPRKNLHSGEGSSSRGTRTKGGVRGSCAKSRAGFRDDSGSPPGDNVIPLPAPDPDSEMAPQAPVGLSRPQAEMTLEDAVLAACSATGSDTIDLADLEAVA